MHCVRLTNVYLEGGYGRLNNGSYIQIKNTFKQIYVCIWILDCSICSLAGSLHGDKSREGWKVLRSAVRNTNSAVCCLLLSPVTLQGSGAGPWSHYMDLWTAVNQSVRHSLHSPAARLHELLKSTQSWVSPQLSIALRVEIDYCWKEVEGIWIYYKPV